MLNSRVSLAHGVLEVQGRRRPPVQGRDYPVTAETRSTKGLPMTEIPSWHITGDWFDNCSCAVACPCTFAQAPDNGFCESVLFWYIRQGNFGDVPLDDLSFVRV